MIITTLVNAVQNHYREEFIRSILGGYAMSRGHAGEMAECARSRGLDWKIIDKGNPYFVILECPETEPRVAKPEDFIIPLSFIPKERVEGEEIFVPVN